MKKTDHIPRKPGRPKDKALIARRCEQILDVATQVFADEGYRQADVQVVADKLGVGKGTVYRYFPTKEALFLAAVDRGVRQLKERVDAATTEVSDPLDRIATGLRAYLAFFDEHGEIVELFIQERAEFKDRKQSTYFVHREANIEPWRALVKGLIDAGRLRAVPVSRIIDVLNDLMYGAIFTNRLAGRRKALDIQAAEILDIVFHGILTHPEREQQRGQKCRQPSSNSCNGETR